MEDNEIAAKRHKKRKTDCFYAPFASFRGYSLFPLCRLCCGLISICAANPLIGLPRPARLSIRPANAVDNPASTRSVNVSNTDATPDCGLLNSGAGRWLAAEAALPAGEGCHGYLQSSFRENVFLTV